MHARELHQNTPVEFGIHRTFSRAPEARAAVPFSDLISDLKSGSSEPAHNKDALRVLKQWAQPAYSMASCPRTSY
jgi:hypothetical protein